MTIYSNFTIDEDIKEVLIKQGIKIPSYNFFDDPEAIKISNTSKISEDLIPVEEIKITINKESYTLHTLEWNPIFVHHYESLSWNKELANNHFQYYTTKKIMDKCLELLTQDTRKEEEKIRKNIEQTNSSC